MECQYCKNIFKNNASLKTHQKNAKYCIELQDSEKVSLFECESCGKKFGKLANLKQHLNVCKKKNNYTALELENVKKELDKYKILYQTQKETIQKLEERINDLEDKLENVAVTAVSRPTSITTNNNHNQNNNQNNILMNLTPFDMNKEKFAEKIREHFNKNYLINGQKGVAQFVVENILKDEEGKLMYICTDPSRQIYRFKSTDGFIERDVKAKKLTTALYDEIRSKSHSISSEEIEGNNSDIFLVYSGRFQDIKELEEDSSEFRIELANLTTK